MDNIYVPRPGSNVSTGDATEQTVGGGMSSENMTLASQRKRRSRRFQSSVCIL